MIPAVPFAIRVVMTLALMMLAFLVEVLAILLAALAAWITPELETSKNVNAPYPEPKR